MSRATFRLANSFVRQRVLTAVKAAPEGCIVEIREPGRNLDQNAALWAALTDISLQARHHDRRLAPERWKALFLDALGQELDVEPSLDGSRMVPIGNSSSRLTKTEFSGLLDVVHAWGAANGVTFHDSGKGAEGAGGGASPDRAVAA